MRFHTITGTCLLAFASNVVADIPRDHVLWGPAGPPVSLERRAATTSTSPTSTSTKVADSQCTNGPNTRQCWSNGYSAATDFDAKFPTTGKTRTYNLELTNSTCNPDGNGPRQCQLFNNQYPGPVITADWGDMISVTIKNSLTGNGTGIHWHGIRMLNNNPTDGVGGITECPIAPGDSKTYTFQASQHGTTWYHSHVSAQYGDGAFGPLVINGPASSNYDVDLGTYTVNDFFYKPIWQVAAVAHANFQAFQGPPTPDTILVNGTNKNAAGGGSYSRVTGLTKNKKYRLRLINTSVDNSIWVSLDSHNFTVMTTDLVPIKPFSTQWLLLAIGQRYDVVFTANQAAGNYWFRAEAAGGCASANSFHGRGVFSYSGQSGDPAASDSAAPSGCTEPSPLVPWVSNTVGSVDSFKSQAASLQVNVDVAQTTTNGQNIVFWGVNLTGIDVSWDKPTLQYVKDGNTSYPSTLNLIEIPNEGVWSYWIIQEPSGTPVPIPHPIHLHGHDFYILGQGSGVFDINSTPNTLTYTNPPRRDVAFLPGGGWLALAFPADNPGAWLMHCHIAFHVSDGLGVQFLEAKGSAPKVDDAWAKTCANWNKYDQNPVYNKTDSGL